MSNEAETNGPCNWSTIKKLSTKALSCLDEQEIVEREMIESGKMSFDSSRIEDIHNQRSEILQYLAIRGLALREDRLASVQEADDEFFPKVRKILNLKNAR